MNSISPIGCDSNYICGVEVFFFFFKGFRLTSVQFEFRYMKFEESVPCPLHTTKCLIFQSGLFLINKEFPCWNWYLRKFLLVLCEPGSARFAEKIRNFLLRLSADIILVSFFRQTWHNRFVLRTLALQDRFSNLMRVQ